MNLRNKYNALLMAFSQQEQPIAWSGNFVKWDIHGIYINYNPPIFRTYATYNLWFIPIPKGAKKITIYGKSLVYPRYIYCVNNISSVESELGGYTRTYNSLIALNTPMTVNDKYKYVIINAYNTSVLSSYEFT